MTPRVLIRDTDKNERIAELTTIGSFVSVPNASVPIVLFSPAL
jgi:hypothetical protein